MDTKFPRASYGVGILPIAINAVAKLMETVGANTIWFAQHIQPYLEPLVWPFAPTFLLGLFIQDLYNNRSWPRQTWSRMTRAFVVENIIVSVPLERDRIYAKAQIRFTRNIRSAELLLRIFSCTKSQHGPYENVLELMALSNVHKGETRVVNIVHRAVPSPGWTPINSTWGTDGLNSQNPNLSDGSKNVAVLELTRVWIPQRHRLFVFSPQYGNSDFLPGLYVQDEDEDIFDTKGSK